MRKSILLFWMAIACAAINGQELSPQVLSPGGEVFSTSDYSLSWTLGELAVGSLENSEAIVQQGFTYETSEATSISNPVLVSTKFYPNPVHDRLTIEFINSTEFIGEVKVTDILGNLVIRKSIVKEGKISIDMGSFPSSMYIIQVMDSNKKTIQIKNIIKQ